uniref:Uncharacterized protein n=1 Tax=Rhizophora mucronata TaxID=61149 RepID=A0A2P2JXS6_RHIMU
MRRYSSWVVEQLVSFYPILISI